MKCRFPPCQNEVPLAKFYGWSKSFCSKACMAKEGVNRLRRKRKLGVIKYLGGSCQRCGFDEHESALQFHHRDPSQKDFGINRGISKRFELVKAELDKCDLLCANCHSIVHALLAQPVERESEELGVGGANPSESTNMIEPAHGTRARYLHPQFRCKCPACRVAQRDYMREYHRSRRIRQT